MTAIAPKGFSTHFQPKSRFYEVDIPYLGLINVDLFGVLTWKSACLRIRPEARFADIFAGPLHIEFQYAPETRANRGTLALLALAVAGWTEGHCWHLPFLG